MHKFETVSSDKRSMRNERGQAIVEYILILVVVIGVALGSIYQFNDAFRAWANNYFGDYIACLLETGELPSIDGNPGDTATCEQLYKPFSLTDGKPLIAQNKDGSGGGGGNNTSDASSRSKAGAGTHYDSGPAFGSSGSSGGNSYAASESSRGQDSNSGTISPISYGNGSSDSSKNSSTTTKMRLDTKFAFDGQQEQAERQHERQVNHNNDGRGPATTETRLITKKKLTDDAEQTSTISDWSFGNIMRLLIILAIVIALIAIGMQVVQTDQSD